MVKLVVAFLLLGCLLLGGCQAALVTPMSPTAPPATAILPGGEVEVPFETVALDDGGASAYPNMPPSTSLLLLTSPEQVADIASWVSPQALADLQQVDFEQDAVVSLFRETMRSAGRQTVIERITRQDDRLIVQAQFWWPDSAYSTATPFSAPYHLVKVDKQLLPAGTPVLALQAQMLTPTPPDMPTAAATFTSGEVDVPFVTIALKEDGSNIPYDGWWNEPRLLLLTSSEQISEIESWVTPQTLSDLQQVDFERHAVVALFRGWQPSLNHQTIIKRIIRRDNHLVVYAEFWSPSPMYESGAAETSPYHLVRVDKQQVPGQSIELVLQAYMLTPTPPAN